MLLRHIESNERVEKDSMMENKDDEVKIGSVI